jgi:hypothetical protein
MLVPINAFDGWDSYSGTNFGSKGVVLTNRLHTLSCLAALGANASITTGDYNATMHFKRFKQWFEYHHLLLLRDIWWSKF